MDETVKNSQNNLNELNDILFKTLRGVETGEVDQKKAQTVANLGNTIINNAKTQLQAWKLSGGRTGLGNLEYREVPPALDDASLTGYDRQLAYAKERGYDNVAEAIADLGKYEFMNRVKTWRKK